MVVVVFVFGWCEGGGVVFGVSAGCAAWVCGNDWAKIYTP